MADLPAMAPPSVSSLDPQFVANERVKQDAAQHIVALPLTMLALGAMARGALGVRDLMLPASLPRNPSRVRSIGMPGQKEEKVAEDLPALDPQTGHLAMGEPTNMALGAIRPLVRQVYEKMLAANPSQWAQSAKGMLPDSLQSYWRGDRASTVSGVPAAGLAIPLGIAGLGAGYGVVDKALDMRQDSERKRELDQLRNEFQGTISKTAAEQLDHLAETRTKEAFPTAEQAQRATWDTAGWATGLQNAAALSLALAAGKLSHDYFKDRSRRKILDEAMKRRAAMRNSTELTPAHVVPLA